MVGATRKRPDHSRFDRPPTRRANRVVEQKNANGIEMGVDEMCRYAPITSANPNRVSEV